jgi:hypothetical protein
MRDSFDFKVQQEGGGVTLFRPMTPSAKEFAADIFRDAIRLGDCYAVRQGLADKVILSLVCQRSFAISVDGPQP